MAARFVGTSDRLVGLGPYGYQWWTLIGFSPSDSEVLPSISCPDSGSRRRKTKKEKAD